MNRKTGEDLISNLTTIDLQCWPLLNRKNHCHETLCCFISKERKFKVESISADKMIIRKGQTAFWPLMTSKNAKILFFIFRILRPFHPSYRGHLRLQEVKMQLNVIYFPLFITGIGIYMKFPFFWYVTWISHSEVYFFSFLEVTGGH